MGVEDVLSGWEISTDAMPPFEKMQALTDASADMSADEFGARVAGIFDARRSDLAALSDADLEQPSWTPVGQQSYGGFLGIRIFDMWVHVRDCTIPLGRATDDSGAAAEITLDQVESSIGYIMGKKVGPARRDEPASRHLRAGRAPDRCEGGRPGRRCRSRLAVGA